MRSARRGGGLAHHAPHSASRSSTAAGCSLSMREMRSAATYCAVSHALGGAKSKCVRGLRGLLEQPWCVRRRRGRRVARG